MTFFRTFSSVFERSNSSWLTGTRFSFCALSADVAQILRQHDSSSVCRSKSGGTNFYRDFSDVATGLWRGFFEPYAMSRVVPAFQIRHKFHRRRPQIWRPSTSMDNDHVEKVLALIRQNRRLIIREVSEEAVICKSSCHLILTDKLKMRRVATKFVSRLLTDG